MGIKLERHRSHGRIAFGITLALTLLCGTASAPLPADQVVDGATPAVFDAAPAHDAAVGTAPGSADTEGGAATYRLPIIVPPGRAGMEPTLALTYNSRSGNGIAGMGTSLSGLSSIHRCPQTLEQDGAMRAVKYDGNDRLCLDGQRLVPVSGSYGANGTVYRTEVDAFTRVTQVGPLTGSGTCFKAELKSGRVLSYGAPVSGTTCATSTRNARVQPSGAAATLSWLAEREEDRVGNTILYGYTDYGNGEVLIAAVDYTGFGATAGDRHVTFTYAARPSSTSPSVIDNDVSVSYLGGGLTLQSRRLTRINTWVGAQAVRAYKLDYTAAGTRTVSEYSGRSLLQSVAECAYDASTPNGVCHPATGFFWEDAPVAYTLLQPAIPNLPNIAALSPPPDTALQPGDPQPAPKQSLKTVGDLDGDGGQEVLLQVYAALVKTYLMKSSPDRTFSSAVDVSALGIGGARWNYVDFDGDGRADVVKTVNGDGWVHLLTWKLGRGQWSTDPNALFRDVTTDVPQSSSAYPVYYADFDGDGRTDVAYDSLDPVCGTDAGGTKHRLSIYLNRIEGRLVDGAAAHFVRAAEDAPLCLGRGYTSGGSLTYAETFSRAADFDGDGHADLFIAGGLAPNQQRLIYVKPGSGADAVAYASVAMTSIGLSADEVAPSASNAEKLVRWMDINGDGLEDFVFAQTGGSGAVPNNQWIVRLNKGGTLTAPIATGNATGLGTWGNTVSGAPPVGPRFRYSSKIAPIDADSDGRQELLVPARIGAMYCSSYKVPPPSGQVCTAPPSGTPQLSGEMPPCSTVLLCPVDPATGNEIVPTDHTFYFNAYSSDSPGWDQSTYVMHPLRFVVGGVNGSTGLPTITVQEVQKDIYGDQVDDLYGDGLTDVLTSIGCANCTAITTGTPNTPSMLPNGTSVASLINNTTLFVNQNAGIGTDGPRPPELMHAAVNGVDDWAGWVYVPLALPTAVNSVYPLPIYTLPSTNPYVDARHYYFTSSMPVVQTMVQSTAAVPKEDPTFAAGARSRSFSYQEAMYNRLGRGFQGFRKITETTIVGDELAGRRQQVATTYHQKFPLTGKVQSVVLTDPARPSLPLRRQTLIWRCNRADRAQLCPGDGAAPTAPQAGTVYAPYLDSDTVDTFDLAASEAGNLVASGSVTTINAVDATASGWDLYGNLKDQIVTHRDGLNGLLNTQVVTTHWDYSPSASLWWLDKLDKKTVTTAVTYTGSHALPAGASAPSQTVTTTYQWNADRTPASQTVQPSVPNQTLTTVYGYPTPSYGLPTTVSVSGSMVSPAPRTTTMSYSKNGTSVAADGYFVLQTTNPMGHVTTTEHRPGDGVVTRTIDPTNRKTIAVPDAFGRIYRTDYLDANDSVLQPSIYASWTACANGSCPGGYGEGPGETYAAWRVTTTQEGYPTTVTWYDKLGRTVKSARSGFNGLIQTLTEYDVMGTVTRTSAPHYAGSQAYWTTFDQYDRLGRVRQKTAPGAELDPAHGDVRTTYAYSGLKTTIQVRATGVPALCSAGTNLCMDMTRTYDSLGRLQQTVQNLGATVNYAATNYWYDGSGNPVAARDAEGNVIKAAYDALGRRVQMTDPDAGTWTFTYDGLGELLTQTDARGVQTAHTYDALGRLTQRTATNPNPGDTNLAVLRDTWSYDPIGANGGPGLLGSTQRQWGPNTASLSQIWKETLSYEAASKRLSSRTTDIVSLATPWTTSYTYDGWARLSVRNYPSSLSVYTPLDTHGFVTGLQDGSTFQTWWTVTGQDAYGNVTAESYAGGINGMHQTYPATGQIKQKKWTSGSTVLDQWDYSYDSFANLIQQKRTLGTAISTETYTYDGLQRLASDHIEICGAFVCSEPADQPQYAYSSSGNLTFKSDYSTAIPGAYVYAGNGCGPHGVSQVATPSGTMTYQCDANGNVVGGNTLTSGIYDFQNLPWHLARAGFGDAWYSYDPNGQRIAEFSTSQKTWYGPDGYERTEAGVQTTLRHELGPVTITRIGALNGAHANLRDRLGSTAALTNGTAALASTRAYDPFGRARDGNFGDRSGGTLDLLPNTLRGFTGHEHVDDLRVIHMNGRLFDYQLGRFLGVDPVIQFPSNSQSLNPYSYLQNNPFSGKDPSGYCEETLGTHIKDCVTVTANYSDGSSRNLGSFNRDSPSDMAKAASIPLSNGADAMAPNGAPSKPANGDTSVIGTNGKTASSRADNNLAVQRLGDIVVTPTDDDWYDAWKRDDTNAFLMTPVVALTGFITGTNPWRENAPGDDSIEPATLPGGWGVALKSGAIAAGVIRSAVRAEETFETITEIPLSAQKFLSSGRETQVYIGYKNNEAVYCGITCNISARQIQHGDRFRIRALDSGGLTRGQARAVEQALIIRNPQFQNLRNSISPNHSYYNDAVRWGENWLRANGF